MTSRRKWIWRAALLLGATILSVAGWAAHQRYVLKNFHAIVEGQVYRSAQPSPDDLRVWKERYGLRSVITLQGWSGTRAVIEERKVADALGLRHAFNYMSSDRLPSLAEVTGLVRLLDTEPRPLLIHCRGGVDRTGLASVLAAMSIGGQDYATAMSQLSVRYLKVPKPGPNVNDLFGAYEAHCGRTGAARGGWKEFRAWLENVYKPSYYFALIEVPASLSARPGETLTIQARITNGAHEIMPFSDRGREFQLIAFTPAKEGQRWVGDIWGRVSLPRQDVAPGGSVAVSLPVRFPPSPGAFLIRFDLEEVEKDYFAVYGSPVPTCTVAIQ